MLKLNCLEGLPDLAYRGIVQYVSNTDKLNLRLSSTSLYRKTTQLDPKFKAWSFDVCKALTGNLPDFITESTKEFCIFVNYVSPEDVDPMANFFIEHATRISRIIIVGQNSCKEYQQKLIIRINELEPVFSCLQEFKLCRIEYPFPFPFLSHFFKHSLNSLQKLSLYAVDVRNCFPNKDVKFTQLKTLIMISCKCDGPTLAQFCAPPLEQLRLYGMHEFDLSTLSQTDPAFSKLKNVNIAFCEFEIDKIITRCYNSVRKLKLNSRKDFMFELIDFQFTRLKHLIYSGHEENGFNLVGKAARCLDRLSIEMYTEADLPLKENGIEPLNIKWLECNFRMGKINNFDDFIQFCPKIEKLEVHGHFNCGLNCVQSCFKASTDSLERVYMKRVEEKMDQWDLPRMPKIDTVILQNTCTVSSQE